MDSDSSSSCSSSCRRRDTLTVNEHPAKVWPIGSAGSSPALSAKPGSVVKW